MPQQFESRQWLPFPVELVFAFFANPSNLPYIMPPRLKIRIEDAHLQPPPPRPIAQDPSRRFLSISAGIGSEIIVSFVPIPWVPKRLSWMARITEFVWNDHFCDEQVRGPFTRYFHRHGIQAQSSDGREGTLVTDEIDFVLPWGVAGEIGGMMVRRQLAQLFAHRRRRLPEILAAASLQAARRG
jgi:ligand-binding SRPBCC domain-containing protein